MNDRAYKNGHERDLGAGVYEDDEPVSPGDPVCPSCRKITTVQRAGALWWCAPCDLAFETGDSERVNPRWVQRYRDRREKGYPEPMPPQRYHPSADETRPLAKRTETKEGE